MRADYVVRRFGVFVLIVWAAATINFVLPRLAHQDPFRVVMLRNAMSGGAIPHGLDEMTESYDARFGLDRPLWQQYLTYVGGMLRLDFGYSLSSYPQRVSDMIGVALPWTIGLLLVSIVLSWVVGSLLGAIMGWGRAPTLFQVLMPPLLALHALPYFVLSLVLIYLLGFRAQLFPLAGGYTTSTMPQMTLAFALDVIHHAILPGLSIVLASFGGWALGMRAMIVTTRGEDFMLFAEAKGLKNSSIFLRYALRNALLPQTTALALSLGQSVSGSVLVETIFSYPGIGTLLSHSIRASDYPLVAGLVFIIIVAIGGGTLLLDLLYPVLDPRITYRKA